MSKNLDRRTLLQGAAALALAPTLAQAQSAVGGTLVLYTSQPERDAKETIAAFNARYPQVKVEVFRSGTTEVINRLRTEIAAGAPRPDVLLIADAVSMEQLKADGRLARIRTLDTSRINPAFYDEQRTYVGTKLITTGLVVNTRSPVRPASWRDLLAPALKGSVVMPSPLYSGAAAITVGSWAQTPGLGWKFVEDLKAHGATAVRGNGAVLQQVATGEKQVGVLVDFMALNAKKKGSPVEFIVPSEGLTFVSEPAAMLNTSKNPDAAAAFIQFLVSPEAQTFATTLGYYPLVAGVQPPAGYPDAATLKFLPVPASALLRTAEEDRKRFSTIFGG